MDRTVTLAIALALAPALGGCLTPADEDPATNTTAPTTAMNATLPAPIEDSKEVTGGADPLNTAMQPPCSTPQNQCQRYPFTLNRTANITADLSWTVPTNDFDVYVFQDGQPTVGAQGNGADSPPGTSEHLEGELEAGEYELVVVPWSVSRDTYTVSATFA